MNIQELQRAIEEYPQRYQRALSRRTKAEAMVKQLEEELELERSLPEETDSEEPATPQGETYDQVEACLEEKSNEISLAVRRNPTDYSLPAKPTEGAIRAVINTDPEIKKLKAKLQELRPQRHMTRYVPDIQPLSPKAQKIQERLWKAREDQAEAEIEIEIEVLEAQLETYKLLTTILTTSFTAASR